MFFSTKLSLTEFSLKPRVRLPRCPQVKMELAAEHCWFGFGLAASFDVAQVKCLRRVIDTYVVTALGWSGSAYVGGIIIDQYGFNIVFYCTAALQVRIIVASESILEC